MKSISLSGSSRKNVGKKDAKKVRNEGMVPAVIYGGNEQHHVLLSEKEFSKVLFTPETYVINVNVDGKTVQTILQDVQYHPVSDKTLHADLYEINETKPFTVSLPIKLTGTSKGVLRGGKLQQRMRKVRVNGLLHNLPDYIEVDITNVDAGSPIRIEDIKYDNLTFIDSKRNVVVDLKSSRTMADEEGAEGAEE
ncbi:MAG: 50S ribosomal protein L25 [Bacteroidales bacterium]|jgi:large subunit ribosomal protein L25|nr:50S ribosomal protein L25 [Bacteroidales bacterium]